MKLGYFGYCLENNNRRYRKSLRDILLNLARIKDSSVFDRFGSEDQSVYLFSLSTRVFLFVQTRDSELIHAINKDQVSHQDIYNRLETNEKLGFGSYIYMGDGFFAMASTIKGPKINVFEKFICDLLRQLDLNYDFVPLPLMRETTAEELVSMPYVGKTIIGLQAHRPEAQGIMGILFGSGQPRNLPDVRALEIIIKPHSQQSLDNDTVRNVTGTVTQSEDGLEKYRVRAKEEISDQLNDYYIHSQGQLSDDIQARVEMEIHAIIEEKVSQNNNITALLEQVIREHNVRDQEINAISKLRDIDEFCLALGADSYD